MAELLVRVVDKTNPSDAQKDAKLSKRGDVIMVVEDGYAWTGMELTLTAWRIFRWPSITVSEASVFLTSELPTAPPAFASMPDPMLQRRGFYLDIDLPALPAAMRAYVADSKRIQPWFDVPASVKPAQMKRQRPKRADPTVIG